MVVFRAKALVEPIGECLEQSLQCRLDQLNDLLGSVVYVVVSIVDGVVS